MGKYLGIIMKILCVKGEYKVYVIPKINLYMLKICDIYAVLKINGF